jgi:hypothetical protein
MEYDVSIRIPLYRGISWKADKNCKERKLYNPEISPLRLKTLHSFNVQDSDDGIQSLPPCGHAILRRDHPGYCTAEVRNPVGTYELPCK